MNAKLLLGVAGALALAACSQSDDADTTAEETAATEPTAAATPAAPAPQDFVDTVAASDMFEIEAAKLAQDQGTSDKVKAFAAMMIKDHTASTAGLKAAAEQDGVAVPRQMVSKDVKNIDRLEKLSGGAFDNKYISEQRAAHQQALALFTAYAKDGSGAALKAHAAKTAPVVEMHLDHLKTLR